MQKVVFSGAADPESMRKRKETLEKLAGDPKIARFLKDNGLDRSQMENCVGKLQEFVLAGEVCDKCVSVDTCPFLPKGYRPLLKVIEGRLSVETGLCRVQKKDLEQQKKRDNYLYCDMSPKEEKIYLSDLILSAAADSPVKYLSALIKVSEWYKGGMENGLYLAGLASSGREKIACGLINEAAKAGKKCACYDAVILSQQYKNSSFAGAADDPVSVMAKADLLLLRQVGDDTITSNWRDEVLLPVLNYRCSEGKPVILTSSYLPEGLRDHYTYTIYREEDAAKADTLVYRVNEMTELISLL